MKQFTCIICPRGCSLTINEETKEVTGNFCPRGKQYAINEISNPVRTITSSIRVLNRRNTLVSVKLSAPIPKEYIFKTMNEINKQFVNAPVHIGDVVKKNICNLNVDLIITKNIK